MRYGVSGRNNLFKKVNYMWRTSTRRKSSREGRTRYAAGAGAIRTGHPVQRAVRLESTGISRAAETGKTGIGSVRVGCDGIHLVEGIGARDRVAVQCVPRSALTRDVRGVLT